MIQFPVPELVETKIECISDLGALNLRICKGLEFTSEHQMPIVRPEQKEPPCDIRAFYRLKELSDSEKKGYFGHFYTKDSNFEKVWSRPYAYIEEFKKFGAIISPDFSILENMLEPQRIWNCFRNKALSAFYQKHKVPVIASPSWTSDLKNIVKYLDGWPCGSVIAINSTGVCRDKRSRFVWLDGYNAMLSILKPTHILRYGGYIEGENASISTYYENNNKI